MAVLGLLIKQIAKDPGLASAALDAVTDHWIETGRGLDPRTARAACEAAAVAYQGQRIARSVVNTKTAARHFSKGGTRSFREALIEDPEAGAAASYLPKPGGGHITYWRVWELHQRWDGPRMPGQQRRKKER